MAGIFWRTPIADNLWPLSIGDIPWPGPIDGIPRRVPMADIVGLILRSLNEVLDSMEIDHGVLGEGGFYWRINTLKRVIVVAHCRQRYVADSSQGRGEINRNVRHRLMADLLRDIRESDYKCREAFYDPRLSLELVGNRRIRRRNKQRRRRAQLRWIQAKRHLELCIRELIHEALLYHLICEIEKEQGRSFEFSVVSSEIDVRVIEVMITLFPNFSFMVTSCINLVGRFQHYDVFPEIQDGDGPWKYRLWRTQVVDLVWFLLLCGFKKSVFLFFYIFVSFSRFEISFIHMFEGNEQLLIIFILLHHLLLFHLLLLLLLHHHHLHLLLLHPHLLVLLLFLLKLLPLISFLKGSDDYSSSSFIIHGGLVHKSRREIYDILRLILRNQGR